MKEQYLASVETSQKPPFALEYSRTAPGEQEARCQNLAAQISQILEAEGITTMVVGSHSAIPQIGQDYIKNGHDIDFVVHAGQINGVCRTLRRNGFTFWDENSLHRLIRSATGGFGRHHNFGASLPFCRHDEDLPVWVGFFTAESLPEQTIFRERYAFSWFKAITALTWLWQKETDFALAKRKIIETLCQQVPSTTNMKKIIEILKEEGVNFWEIINHPEVNDQDLQRRLALPPQAEEYLVEAEMVQTYPLASTTHFDQARIVNPCHGEIRVYPLEGTFLRMSQYPPHYLGLREKYRQLAQAILASGKLDGQALTYQENLYRHRQTSHQVLEVYFFQRDQAFARETLSQTPPFGQPDYWAILLEKIHYKQK